MRDGRLLAEAPPAALIRSYRLNVGVLYLCIVPEGLNVSCCFPDSGRRVSSALSEAGFRI